MTIERKRFFADTFMARTEMSSLSLPRQLRAKTKPLATFVQANTNRFQSWNQTGLDKWNAAFLWCYLQTWKSTSALNRLFWMCFMFGIFILVFARNFIIIWKLSFLDSLHALSAPTLLRQWSKQTGYWLLFARGIVVPLSLWYNHRSVS